MDMHSNPATNWTIEQAIDWLRQYPWGNAMVALLGPEPDPDSAHRWLRRVVDMHARMHVDAGANYAIDSGDDDGADDVAGHRAMAADLYD